MKAQKGSEVKLTTGAELIRCSKCNEVRRDSNRELKTHQETRTAGQFDTTPAPLCLQESEKSVTRSHDSDEKIKPKETVWSFQTPSTAKPIYIDVTEALQTAIMCDGSGVTPFLTGETMTPLPVSCCLFFSLTIFPMTQTSKIANADKRT